MDGVIEFSVVPNVAGEMAEAKSTVARGGLVLEDEAGKRVVDARPDKTTPSGTLGPALTPVFEMTAPRRSSGLERPRLHAACREGELDSR